MAAAKQQTLSFEVRGEVIVSRPLDFEAMCLMNDIHTQPNRGKYSICMNAVPYMFEGTKVTNEVLRNASVEEMAKLCDDLWQMYNDVIVGISKKKSKNVQSPAED